jgi:collagenase-like PrtC family protease
MARSFTISARGKANNVPIMAFLDRHFTDLPRNEIDSIFGFVERSPLYGGRIFTAPELTAADVRAMYENRIGVRLPLTNHHVDPAEYEDQAPLLDVFHRDGNAAIVTNDDLARWIRRDFPKYRIEASVIKNLKTHDRIKAALDLYDTAVLPMELNEDEDFLAGAPEKHRITLFANAGCALTCPSKICYMSISKINKSGDGEFMCSQTHKERDMLGMLDFDLDRLSALGFSRFKVLRSRASGITGY